MKGLAQKALFESNRRAVLPLEDAKVLLADESKRPKSDVDEV